MLLNFIAKDGLSYRSTVVLHDDNVFRFNGLNNVSNVLDLMFW